MPPMLEFAATVFVTFLVIIDPVGTLPLFVALTHRHPKDERRLTAIRSIVVAAVTLAVFAVAGQLLLRLLGITLLLLSIDMVFARKSGIRWTTAAETEEAEESVDVAVFPLAIPLIAGPGALTSVILLMGRAHGDLMLQAIVIGFMLLVLGLCLLAFLFAIPLMDRLGVTGINVVDRVFGVVLAALAVQNVLDGAIEVLTNLRVQT